MKIYHFTQHHSVAGKEVKINRSIQSTHPKGEVLQWLKKRLGVKIEMR